MLLHSNHITKTAGKLRLKRIFKSQHNLQSEISSHSISTVDSLSKSAKECMILREQPLGRLSMF